MTTGVFKGEIHMIPLHSPGPKIGGYVETASNYLSRVPSCSQFCPKIRCHCNRSWQGRNFNDIIK